MPVRPLAAYRLRPVHKPVVRRSTDADLITLLTEGEALSIRSMKQPMKVLKSSAVADAPEVKTTEPLPAKT